MADRRRFFDIAMGSAQEVAGAFDILRLFDVLGIEDCARGQDLCDHIASMLERFK